MTAQKIIASLAFVLITTSAAFAQSPYTTGTVDSSAAAGLPVPYSYGRSLYAYVPGYRHHVYVDRRRRR